MMQPASPRVLVRGHIPGWLPWVRTLALIAAAVGAILFTVDVTVATGVLVISSILFITLQTVLIYYRSRQQWFTDTGTGFVIEDRQGRRNYDDADIYSVDMEVSSVYSQGVHKGERRVFRMKVQDEPREIELVNTIPPNTADPLAPFIQRVIEAYRDQALEALDAGARVNGKSWSLSSSDLTVGGKASQVIPLADVSSFGVFDRQVCVWRGSESEACLKIPVRSKNAFLLQLLLAHRLSETAQDPDAPATGSALGRVLFERKGSSAVIILLGVLAAALSLGAVGKIISAIDKNSLIDAVWSVVLFGLAGLCIAGLFQQKRSLFRCHESGVIRRGLFAEKQLMYAEVDEFTYAATRQYYNGIYIGTALKMELAITKGARPVRIRFTRTVKNADEDLEELTNHISGVIGAKLLERFANGERVPWTENLALVPEGIEYRPRAFVGRRKEPTVIPFEKIVNFAIDEGVFHVWTVDGDKSVVHESVGARNFFPGYFALHSLYAAASAQEEATSS